MLHLSPKAFDLLGVLVEHRPKVLDKNDLQARLWPDTYVVEGNLNVLIGETVGLGDVPRDPGSSGPCTASAMRSAAPSSSRRMRRPAFAAPVLARDEGRHHPRRKENIVGRSPDSNVWLDFPSVSRRHARIVVDHERRRVVVEDLNSKNGTLVGGNAVRADRHRRRRRRDLRVGGRGCVRGAATRRRADLAPGHTAPLGQSNGHGFWLGVVTTA